LGLEKWREWERMGEKERSRVDNLGLEKWMRVDKLGFEKWSEWERRKGWGLTIWVLRNGENGREEKVKGWQFGSWEMERMGEKKRMRVDNLGLEKWREWERRKGWGLTIWVLRNEENRREWERRKGRGLAIWVLDI
jgi:hypothetical protein